MANQIMTTTEKARYDEIAASPGIIVLSNSVPIVTSIGTGWTKLIMTDTMQIDESNGHMSWDNATNVGVIHADGVYTIGIVMAAEFGNNVDAEFAIYINGVEGIPGAKPIYTGRGAGKPISIMDRGTIRLSDGDTLEIYSKFSSAGDITVDFVNVSVKKEIL